MGELMMMKKTTSALAVAALLGTGAATAATFQVDENTSFGVAANIGYTYLDSTGSDGTSTTDLKDNSSDFRFSGESVSENGLTTTLYAEFDGWGTSNGDADTGDFITDQMYIGLGGDFGTVQLGTDLGTYGVVDGLKDIDIWSGVTGFGNNADNSILYSLPSMDSLSVQIGANAFDDGNTQGSGTSVNAGVVYDLGAVALSAAYDNRAGLDTGDDALYGFGLQTSLGGANVHATYEEDSADDVTLMSLTSTYSTGDLYFYGVVQNVDGDDVAALQNVVTAAGDDSVTQTNFGVGYTIADNISVYAEATRQGQDNDEGDQNSLSVFVGF
jgi:hypothetical protein